MHLSHGEKNACFLAFSFVSLLLISSLNVKGGETGFDNDILMIKNNPVSPPPSINDFLYYKIITINSSMVSGSEKLINFPLLLSLLDPDLKNYAQADGGDITFFIDSVIVDYEIELFNPIYNRTHAQLITWIRIPYLYPSESLNITMCFGNSAIVSQQNPEKVWSIDYKGVWHFSDGLSSTINDSTSNSNDGTVERKIYNLNGEDTYNLGNIGDFTENDAQIKIDYNEDESLDDFSDISIDFWFKLDSITATEENNTYIIKKGESKNEISYSVYINYEGKLCFRLKDSDTSDPTHDVTLDLDTWYHVYCTREYIVGGVNRKIFINGEEIASDGDLNTISNNGEPLFIGSDTFNGCIDEVRLSNSVHSADWIKTEYHNQKDPENFYSVSICFTTDPDNPDDPNDPNDPDDLDDNQPPSLIMIGLVVVLGLSTLILGSTAGYLEFRHIKNKRKERTEIDKIFKGFKDKKRSINKTYAFSPNPGIETEIEDKIIKKPDYVITEKLLKIPHHRVLVTCPTCKVEKELSIPDEIITKARRITVISVPNDLTCKHHFLLFMDRHFEIRGYQGIDFEVRVKKVPRMIKNSEEFSNYRKNLKE